MLLGKQEQFMLFVLVNYYRRLNAKYKNKPIKVVISKMAFIEFLLNLHLTDIKERAIYKNLEKLEKKKLIEYDNKIISITEKGFKMFEVIDKNIRPYFRAIHALKAHDPTKPTSKLRAVLKRE